MPNYTIINFPTILFLATFYILLRNGLTRDAELHEFPYMVSLRYASTFNLGSGYFGGHMCSGFLLNSTAVVTAAQCVYNNHSYTKDKAIFSIVGTNNLTNLGRTKQIMKNYKTIIHPRYRLFDKRNDVAIVRLAQEIVIDGIFVRSVELAKKDFPPKTKCAVHGWGAEEGNFSELLRTNDVILQNKTECQEIFWKKFKYKLGQRTICGISEKGTICKGEIGSPLVCENQVYGIVSQISGSCNDVYIPTLFLNALRVKDFIYFGNSGYYEKPCLQMLSVLVILIKIFTH